MRWDAAGRVEVVMQRVAVARGGGERIAHNDIAGQGDAFVRFNKEHRACVRHGIGKTLVAVMLAREVIESLFGDERARTGVRHMAPRKRPGGNGLRLPVHRRGVVCRRASEFITQAFVARVGERARINQPVHAIRRELERQGIGVRMPATQRSVRPAVNQQITTLVCPSVAQQVVPAVFESA